ncbi:uncharacterized protein LOC105703841 [Orussus abietinus]|uniref:uncharacterized protein LOC105703841 n=1 Tax=Orussus abietinus TaxID=222816 RepID=UPI0006254820|nr:uncharacterized protein LOC105703841 [Orussus abietinus]
MITAKITVLIGLIFVLGHASAMPDSAGIVEMRNGLAYGGIPYGSVSGMVYGFEKPAGVQLYPGVTATGTRVVITPNLRAAGVEARSRGPVQIYNLPGVVAPGVVGTISQIGYK